MNRKNNILIPVLAVAFVLMGLVIYEYGILRVKAKIDSIEEITSLKKATLEKCIRLISEKPDLEKRVSSLRESRKSEDQKLIEGRTPALAAAVLQNIVKGKIISARGTVSSERIDKPETLGAGKLKIISVIFDATMPDTGALINMLYSIETSTPYLLVRELDCKSMNWKEPKQLSIRLKISALMDGR